MRTKVEKQIEKYAQVLSSLEWSKKLLEELKDERLSVLLEIEKDYQQRIFALMSEHEIRKIVVSPTKSKDMTFSRENRK